jgi:hypothetical protein
LKNEWDLIQKNDNINVVDAKFTAFHEKYAELGEITSTHIRTLSEKYGQANTLLQRYEQFLNKKYLKEINKIIEAMDGKIEICRKLVNDGKLNEALKITLDEEIKNLGPSFKTLFKPNKEYTIQSIAHEFDLDAKKTKDFVRFLEENNILSATYKVS